jgi:hypothetical protein
MLRNACTDSGIEIYLQYLGESILYFMFATLILIVILFMMVQSLNGNYIKNMFFLIFPYFMLLVIFGGLALSEG